MNETSTQPVPELRIGAAETLALLRSGRPITFLDVRNDQPWDGSSIEIAGAVRVRPAEWRIDPTWPKDRLTVVY